MIGLARWLCDNYQSNARAKLIVEGMHIYLMPTMNPDGFANGPLRNNRCVNGKQAHSYTNRG